MNVSLIICSYARPVPLATCLATIDMAGLAASRGELILVYTMEDGATAEVMKKFAGTSPVPVKFLHTGRRGLSVARNKALAEAAGDLLMFTDDDCLMSPGYVAKIFAEMNSGPYGYGGGGLHDPFRHALGASQLGQRAVLAPGTLLGAGIISGANMFFRKDVFARLGGFREDMGAGSGTPFAGAEDLEMITRASLAGFAGLLVPDAMIIHQHDRLPGSTEDAAVALSYDLGRGTHYAYLMMRGIHEAWTIWARTCQPNANRQMARIALERLRNEFDGASKYLAYCLEKGVDMPPKNS